VQHPDTLGPDASVAERTIWEAITRGIERIARTNRDPRRPGKQADDWHDCRQDALLKLQEIHEEVQRLSMAENWPALAGLAYTVAHNLAVDWVRKKRPVRYLDDREDDQRTALGGYEAQSPLDRAVETNLFQEVRALLPLISPKEREIFGLYLSLRDQEKLAAMEAPAYPVPLQEQEEIGRGVDGSSARPRQAWPAETDDLPHEVGLWAGLIAACDLNPGTVPSYRDDNLYDQIGAMLTIDPQTARTRMSRARANLRRLYQETYGDLYNAQIT
jgi:RNA polymerase sigma factor (sigma-70 family)